VNTAGSRSYAGVADRGYGLLAAHETGPFGRCIGPRLSGLRELLVPEARFPGIPLPGSLVNKAPIGAPLEAILA
jgi:hypothetical protein